MTPNHKALLDQLQVKHEATKALLKKGSEITGEDLDAVEKIEGEMKSLRDQIEVEKKNEHRLGEASARSDEYQKWLKDPASNIVHPNAPFKSVGMIPSGSVGTDEHGDLVDDDYQPIPDKAFKAIHSKEYKSAFRTYLRVGLADMTLSTRKNLEEGLDPQGGYFAPIDVLNRIISKKPTPTRLVGNVTNLTTSRDRVSMPKVKYSTASDDSSGILYTTPFRVTWTGENPASSTAARVTDTNIAGQVQIPVFTALITGLLTLDMVEDTAFPVQQWAADKFAETADLLKDNMIVNGSGVTQPEGILANPGATDQPSVINSTGSSAQYAADDLFTCAYDVPEQYEENLKWVFNKVSTMKFLRKLKDSNNRYLFGVGYQDSGLAAPQAKTLVDYPYLFSGFVPNLAASSNSIIFGDLTGYYYLNRIGFSIQVLREVYAEKNQIALVGRLRIGGAVVEPWKLRVLQAHS